MRQCTHCGSRVEDVSTHCPNCAEGLPSGPAPAGVRAKNGWAGAGVGCGTYVALSFVMWLSAVLPIPEKLRATVYPVLLAAFFIAVVWVGIANRRPGFLLGYLLVLLIPLGLFGACVGFFALNGLNTR